jgi:hypothetical protein
MVCYRDSFLFLFFILFFDGHLSRTFIKERMKSNLNLQSQFIVQRGHISRSSKQITLICHRISIHTTNLVLTILVLKFIIEFANKRTFV